MTTIDIYSKEDQYSSVSNGSSSASNATKNVIDRRHVDTSVTDKAVQFVEKQARQMRSFHQIFLSVLLMFALATMCLYHMVSETWDEELGGSMVQNLNNHLKDRYRHTAEQANLRQNPQNRGNRNFDHKRKKLMGKGRPIDWDKIGDKSSHYRELREKYDKLYPQDDIERLRNKANTLRQRDYIPVNGEIDCPEYPPDGYPQHFNVVDVIENWPSDDPVPREHIYQGMCVFDYQTDSHKAKNYREAEVPFVVRNDPAVLRPVERWADPEYLLSLMPSDYLHRAEYSENNHFMYWNRPKKGNIPKDWQAPTDIIKMSYPDWLSKANVTDDKLGIDNPHWYFRLIACGGHEECRPSGAEFVFDELTFFRPVDGLYMVDPLSQMGIHCRFGMKGVIAENHFDASRNAIALMGGERRYILSDPENCPNMHLYPRGHPSARHSAVDWSDPDYGKFPRFKDVKVHEIVLQAGDVLYLPTNYFHYIISLDLNFQCNTRSGRVDDAFETIRKCGF